MTENEKRELVKAIFEMVSTGDFSKAGDLLHPDYIDHGGFGELKGIDGFIQLISMFRAGFPDLNVRAVDILIEGDRAAWRVEGTGTHTGEFMGIPATGKQCTFTGVDMGRIEDGKAAEHWSGPDLLGLLQQVGAVPPPPGR